MRYKKKVCFGKNGVQYFHLKIVIMCCSFLKASIIIVKSIDMDLKKNTQHLRSVSAVCTGSAMVIERDLTRDLAAAVQSKIPHSVD